LVNGYEERDDNKGIAEIQYNALNLPVKVVFACPAFDGPVRLRRNNNNFIEWIYTVTGAELRKVEDPAFDGSFIWTALWSLPKIIGVP
jgi:hypothetical protein